MYVPTLSTKHWKQKNYQLILASPSLLHLHLVIDKHMLPIILAKKYKMQNKFIFKNWVENKQQQL